LSRGRSAGLSFNIVDLRIKGFLIGVAAGVLVYFVKVIEKMDKTKCYS
jgi:tetrahydromethanopterin S-methyltransferase subunit F